MPDPAVKYAIEVHKKYRTYWPTWIPNERVAIGDFGELRQGIFFKRLGHVSECGVSKAALKTKPTSGRSDLCFQSKGKVRVRLQADGANAIPGLCIPPGSIGGQIKFTRANAAFLAAVDVKVRALRSEHKLRAELKTKVERGEFPVDRPCETRPSSLNPSTAIPFSSRCLRDRSWSLSRRASTSSRPHRRGPSWRTRRGFLELRLRGLRRRASRSS